MYVPTSGVPGYTKQQLAEVKLRGETEMRRSIVGGFKPLSTELLKQMETWRTKGIDNIIG